MVQRTDLIGLQFGSYRLLRLIGTGDSAEVYLGKHIHLGTQAAVKVLHTQLAHTDIDSFRTEVGTVARLLHPHIIRIHEFNVVGSTPFLAMDYAVGGTMRERYPKGSIVPLPTIVSYTQQVAEALQYAHDQKLIHRDVKPENILLDQDHNVLLSDFGIILAAHNARYTTTQDVIGTAAYMSPEQIQQGKLQPASDQYSLGIAVYEWLCGRWPFEGSRTELWNQHMFTPPPALCKKVPTISPEVEYVVMTALHKDPKQRFGNVLAFATALQQACQACQAGQTQPMISLRSQRDGAIPASWTGRTQPIVSPYHIKKVAAAESLIDSRSEGKRLKWTFCTNDAVYSSPTVVNDCVYVGSNDRCLYAIDATSGRKLWSFLTSKRVESSPTVVNGTVYFGSNDGSLYALDTASGKKRWCFFTGKAVYSSPTVVNGSVYVGSNDHCLYALDATSGRKLWSFRSGNVVNSSPAVSDEVVYFSSDDHNLYALDATSGRKLWSFFTGDFAASSPTVVNGTVYFGSQDRNLYALNAAYGRQKWSFRSGDALFSAPTVANNTLYFGSTDGNLYALDATSGQKRWAFPTGDALFSVPTVANNTLYFGSHDGNLYALDGISGQKCWSFPIGNVMLSSPTVVNGVVYVGSDDGKVYAIFA